MDTKLKPHARARMQQRGIPCAALEVILDFGRECHDHRGAEVVYFDKRSRLRALRALGAEGYRRIERWLDAYAVVDALGEVITVGHRHRRIARF